MTDLHAETSRFSKKVSDFLRRVRYSIAISEEERRAIFKLRYDANLREQTILANPAGMLTDRFDDSENGFNIGVFLEDRLAATLRLHLLCKAFPDSPLIHAYPVPVQQRVDAGLRIIDITRLAADMTIARTEPQLAYATVRLSMLMSEHFEADIILAAVRREHIPFYKREFMATQITAPLPYPTLIKPLCLFEIDCKTNRAAIIARHPFHASDERERESLFGPARWPVLERTLNLA